MNPRWKRPSNRPSGAARRGLLITALICAIVAVVATGTVIYRAATDASPGAANDVPAVSAPTPTATATAQGAVTPPPVSARPRTSRKPSASATAKPPSVLDVGLDESVPTRLRIAAIDVNASFVDLGLTDDGTLQTPDDPARVGWFTGAHTPGAAGVSVIAGHVTWNRRPTVFFGLGRLQRNDPIIVDRQDGSRATFAVRRISTFSKDAFPTEEVYRASATPKLILITCGGTYDETSHSYAANVIVWADLTSVKA